MPVRFQPAGLVGGGRSRAMTGYATTRVHPRLPIFRVSGRGGQALYAPGHRLVVDPEEARGIEDLLRGQSLGPAPAAQRAAACGLLRAARRAAAGWRALAQAPFRPLGLTLYLSNQCPLRCRYCFAADSAGARRTSPGQATLPRLELPAVRAAARLVLEHCRAAGQRFTLVLNGGGEPTVHFDLLRAIIEETKALASDFGVLWWGYLATNGVLPEEHAAYLAQALDRVGLSCDGPPAIQDAQRPLADGRPTSAAIERTAAVLRRLRRPFDVRATVLPERVQYLGALIQYAAGHLGAQSIRITPAYHLDHEAHTSAAFTAEAAGRFAAHFLAAQAIGRQLGCPVELPDVRLHEIHGPYCNVLRSSLHLTPDGLATACFATTEVSSEAHAGFAIGRPAGDAAFVIDTARLGELRGRALRIPPHCQNCHNLLHCARECPEVCLAARGAGDMPREGGFRCLLQAHLGAYWILHPPPPVRPRGDQAAAREASVLAELLAACPPWVSVDEIATGWEQLRSAPCKRTSDRDQGRTAATEGAVDFHPARVSLARMAEALSPLIQAGTPAVTLHPAPPSGPGPEPLADPASLADFVACHVASQWLEAHGFRWVQNSLLTFRRTGADGCGNLPERDPADLATTWMKSLLSRPAAG